MMLLAATPVRTCGDRSLPQPLEPAGDEDERTLVVEDLADPPDSRRRKLRQLAAKPLDHLGRRLDRHEVGLGEIAVVVRLLLRAARRQRPGRHVEVICVLLDLAARLPDADLAGHLGLDPTRDVRERVHVLDLAARPQLVRARGAHRDVRVDPERALLHLRVRDAELDDRLSQQLEEALRLLGRVDVGRRDDLDERRAAAVVVDERVLGASDPPRATTDVNVLCGVLLQMRTDDPHSMITFWQWY